jgi:hypothetical protein
MNPSLFKHFRTQCCQAIVLEQQGPVTKFLECADCHNRMTLDNVKMVSVAFRDKWTEMIAIMMP